METKNKKQRYFAGLLVVIITAVTTYLVYTHPNLNMADLTNTGVSGNANHDIYMPTYNAAAGETGLIEIKTKDNIAFFDSITFALHYNPVNGLTFGNNPIVFDADTVFQDAAFQITASPQPGKLLVTIVLKNPVQVTGVITANEVTHQTLFKLETKVSESLPEGQVIDVSFDEFAALNGINPLALPAIPNTAITVAGQNELKVLNAQAIDSTRVVLKFSDLISNIGTATDYVFTPPLNVVSVEGGGGTYGQNAVVLTTDAQTAGEEYVVTVDPLSGVSGNQQGGVNPKYSNVVFHGFGQGNDTFSDFELESASVSGYTTIVAAFSHEVEAASVNKADFTLTVQGGGVIPINNVNSISGKQVTLTVSTPLLKRNTYLLSVVSDDAIVRESDAVKLGMRHVAFNGSKNGPRLIGATVLNQQGVYKLQLAFDENIQYGGLPNNPVGRLYVTGTNAGTLINSVNSAVYNQAISGTTLTLQNAVFNNANQNFTFSVNDVDNLINSSGVPVDEPYKTISFWGYGHNDALNSVGTVDVAKKNVLRVPGGTLNFDEVTVSDVSVLYDSGGANLSTEAVSSVNKVNNDLEVVMNAPLNPDRHYVLRIVDTPGNNNTLAAKDFVVQKALNLGFAEAVSSTKVRVYFTQNIDASDVDAADFSVNDGGIAVNGLTIDPGFKSVLLDTDGPFNPADIYKVAVTGVDDVYSFSGDALLKTAHFFPGYQTGVANSPVTVSSAEVVDAKTLKLTFSAPVNASSVTPVNMKIFYFKQPDDPTVRGDLVVTSIAKISDTVYQLSTSIQAPLENYFVIFNGVQDGNNLHLANTRPANFFGYQLPKVSVSLIKPNTISNDTETNIVLSGQNLNVVKELKLGDQKMTLSSQSATSIMFKIQAGMKVGLYDITLIDNTNKSTLFKNAILVTEVLTSLKVHSSQSKAIPLSVPNDGETKTKLWLLVEDSIGLANIDTVTVNLSQIGGPSTVEMKKDTGTQPKNSQWYIHEVTVPKTVQTKDAPYLLPVEVRKGNEKYNGTISIRVAKDVVSSIAPVIDQAYITPLAVPPDNTSKLRISAQVSDKDGADTINAVVANLGNLGIGFIPLSPIGELTEGFELETQFYQSEEFTVPKSTPFGTYAIEVSASDATGEKASRMIQIQVTQSGTTPKFNADVSYISPRKSIPNDGKTQFSIHTQVIDQDGIDTVQSVVANFPTLGIPPVNLTREGSGGSTGTYSVTGLTVPTTAPLGVHSIEIVAADNEGWLGNLVLKLDVTHKDTLGDAPRLVTDRTYTMPRVAINDGKTPVTLYAFLQDNDDDIESVVVNLKEIGQVGDQTSGTLGGDGQTALSDGSCPTGSKVIVCMNPSVKEGDKGQWFILPNVTINPSVTPSAHPYNVDIVATDRGNKTTMGQISIYVGTGDQLLAQQESPKVLAAIPTSETTLEILFSKEMSASTVLSSGKGFTISNNNDINQKLPVLGATINPAGTVVTLTTGKQEKGKPYVLSVSSDIKDTVGRSMLEGGSNRVEFLGFKPLNKAPVVEYIHASGIDTVNVEFHHLIKPSSISKAGIKVYESDNPLKQLRVTGVKLLSPGNILQVQTEAQKAETRYRMNIEGLASYDGTALPVAINKGFIGYNLSIAQHAAAANLADLNNDGRVDFADFTIFSSVYGTIYSGAGENVAQSAASAASQAAAAQQGQPLPPHPDALVPITSPVTN